MRGGAVLAHVDLTQDRVMFRLNLADEFLSLHGSMSIPFGHILSVSSEPVPETWWRGFRVGTNLPGIKVAGTFYGPDGAVFCDFHDPARCLTLELDHDRYRRVIVEVDADQSAHELADAIGARTSVRPPG